MKNIIFVLGGAVFAALLFTGFSIVRKGSSGPEVKIGKQVWMTQNLNTDKFRNGDPIPQAKTPEEWSKATEKSEPVWCYYDYNEDNGKTHGKLYNYFAVIDPRGLAPKGWHIPTETEWEQLIKYLGEAEAAGKKLKAKQGWPENTNGNDKSGFSGLPGGTCNYDGSFYLLGTDGSWWSSTACGYDITGAFTYSLSYENDMMTKASSQKRTGNSVRCIKD